MIHFAFIGHTVFSKGIDVVLRAFRKIAQDNNLVLHLYGGIVNPGYYKWINELQRRFPDKLVYHGSFNNSSLPDISANIDACIIPSYFDTYNRVLREILYLGVPVIVTDFFGAYIVENGKNGFKIPIGDNDALAQKMLDIIREPSIIEDLSKGVNRTRIPTLEEEIDQFIEIYNDLCHQTSQARVTQGDLKAKQNLVQGLSDKIEEGEDCFQKGEHKKAEDVFLSVLKDDPDHVEAMNDLATILWKTGRKEESLKYLLNAMEINPHNRDVIWNCGQFMVELGYPDKALDIYKNYLINNSDDGDIRRAVIGLEETDVISENSLPGVDPGQLISNGEDLFQDGRFDEAHLAFEEALAVGGDSALVHNDLAAVHQAKGDFSKAAEHLTIALKLDPENRDALWNCGQLFIQSGLPEDALSVYENFLSKHPDDDEIKQAIASL